jgi:single-strand DNA-binding protein
VNGVIAAVEGYLGQDAELRFTAEGRAVCNFSVAAFDAKRAEDAPTEWIKVTVWGEEAERLAPSLVKGAEVYCHGRLRLNTWTATSGEQRAGLQLSAYECAIKGAIGRKAPRRRDSGGHMTEWEAAFGPANP